MAERHTSNTVITAYKSISVIDTAMRKVEVLIQNSGEIWVRDLSLDRFDRAGVSLIHLYHHEAMALAEVLQHLEPEQATEKPPKVKRHAA